MSDYVPTTDFSAKDALPDSDPEKLILGADLDVEFDALNVAIASKYDSSDIASQAQAEAGVSNEVLMTPLRVAQYVTGASGAGIIPDLIGLTDPGADRILFWDDSANTTTFLTVGTGLAITGTTLAVDTATADHDALLNFVADEHVAHSSVIPTASDGIEISLSGTGIEAAFDYSLAINSLTAETTLDGANDYFAVWDNSALVHKKVNADALVGAQLGDGKWYRDTSDQSISTTESTIIWNAEEQNNLQRGSFNTTTGQYTAGSDGARVLVLVTVRATSLNEGQSMIIKIRQNTSNRAQTDHTTEEGFGAIAQTIHCHTIISCAAGDTIDVRALTNTGTDAVDTGATLSHIEIIELG